MALFEDNLSPYLTAVEQGSTPANPAAGDQKLFIDSADHLLKLVDSSGTVTPVGGGGGSGSITASGYTQATAKLLGRSTATTGAIEEITVGSGLSLSAGTLTATGGGGGGFTADVNEDGSSLTNWTQEAGSWSVVSSSFQVTTPATTANRLKLTAQHPQGMFAFQASVSMVTGGGFSGARWLGLVWGWDGTGAGGTFVGLQSTAGSPSSDGVIYAESPQSTTPITGTPAHTFSLDTFYALTIIQGGTGTFDVFIDGTYATTFGGGSSNTTTAYIGLFAYNCIAQFKSIKSSYLAPTLPL